MANYTVPANFTILSGTGDADTFNVNGKHSLKLFGLGGDDTFQGAGSNPGYTEFGLLDGGAGHDVFNLTNCTSETLLGGADGDQLYIIGGVNNLMLGEGGNDWIGLGVSGGGFESQWNLLDGGDGEDYLGVTGDDNTALGGAGEDTLELNGDQNTALGGDGNDQLKVVGGNLNVLDGGEGDDFLYVQSGHTANLIAGNGNDWLGTNGSQHQLIADAGNDWLGATGSYCALSGDSGSDTVFGNGTKNQLFGGDDGDWVGVSGDFNALFGGAGNDYVAATGNNNVLDGGTGNDSLVVAAGHTSDTFIYLAGYGMDDITGFVPGAGGTDVVSIHGFGVSTFGQLQAFMSQSGSDTVITLNGADILTIHNVLPSQLQANDFYLM